jgi:hypothetical protein
MADSPQGNGAGAAQRAQALRAFRDALGELHRALIEAARHEHERASGVVSSPGELLQLLTTNPSFAWLHPASELLADLDALAAEPPTEDFAAAVRRAGEALVLPPADAEAPGNFWPRYSTHLQQSPAVAVAHGRVRQVLAALPASHRSGQTLHERHQKALEKKRRR